MKIVVGGEEVPSVIAYGIRAAEADDPPNSPGRSGSWRASRRSSFRAVRRGRFRCGRNLVRTRLPPVQLQRATTSTLARLIQAGCRVAWIAVEGLPFCDPSHLCDPGCMSGSVLAWMAEESVGECWINLSAPIALV